MTSVYCIPAFKLEILTVEMPECFHIQNFCHLFVCSYILCLLLCIYFLPLGLLLGLCTGVITLLPVNFIFIFFFSREKGRDRQTEKSCHCSITCENSSVQVLERGDQRLESSKHSTESSVPWPQLLLFS